MWTVLGKLLLVGGRLLWDWVILALRVRRILTNDLPHAEEERREIRAALEQHIGFCRGVRAAGKCPPDESPPHPVTPSPPQ